MQSASLRNLVLAAVLVPVAGCQSPYGYQSPYYGNTPMGTYPQFPSGPVYNTTPSGPTYVPNGQPGTGGPTPLGAPAQPPSTYDNGSGGIKFDNAEPFKTTPPAGGNRGTVPDPQDDLKQDPSASKPDLTPTSSIQRDFQLQPQLEQVPDNTGSPIQPANSAEEEEDPFGQPKFSPPKKISSAAEMPSGGIEQVKYESPPKERNPYGRDTAHANPEWLRGVIDFDPQERTWQIVYAATPDPRDRNGGSLTLGNHRDLSKCRNGDIVAVFGAIDASQVDSRGKPIYALDKVQPLAN